MCLYLFVPTLFEGKSSEMKPKSLQGHRPPRRARDSCDRVKIMVSRPLEGGRVGREPKVFQSSSMKQNRLKSTKIVFVSIHFDLDTFWPYHQYLLHSRRGLNLSEDDLVVNNFGDPKVVAPKHLQIFTVSVSLGITFEISNLQLRLLSLDFR